MPSRSPAGAITATSAVEVSGNEAPGPAASGAPVVVTTPRPTPKPSPTRVESGSFFFTLPAGWRIESRASEPEMLTLSGEAASATFKVVTSRVVKTLKQHQVDEAAAAGAGLMSSQTQTIDQVAGFVVAANVELPEGKRYRVVRGCIYRARYVTIIAAWDRRDPDTDRIDKDVKAILASFRWL